MEWWQYIFIGWAMMLGLFLFGMGWKAGLSGFADLVRIFFGGLNAGVTAAIGVLIGSGSVQEGGKVLIELSKPRLVAAGLLAVSAMLQNMLAYRKRPLERPITESEAPWNPGPKKDEPPRAGSSLLVFFGIVLALLLSGCSVVEPTLTLPAECSAPQIKVYQTRREVFHHVTFWCPRSMLSPQEGP